MNCHCGNAGRTDQDTQQRLDQLAENMGLQEVFSQSRDVVFTVHATARRYLEKAQRAEGLGLGAEVAELYRRAAAREAAQGVRQVDAVVERLDARTRQPDWAEILEGTQQAFQERDGRAMVDNMKERLRLELFERDDISPDGATSVRDLGDRAFDSLVDQGLRGPVQLLREALLQERDDLDSLVAARAVRRFTEATRNCIAVVVAIGAALLIACMFIWGCWCCQTVFIGLLTMAGVLFCCDTYGC